MALAEAQLVAMYPETQYLLDLRDAGWSFLPHNVNGEPAIVGFRSWPTHTDAIWIFGRTRCLGIRTMDNAPGMVAEPSGPARVTWPPSLARF